jgi:molybdopterin converting factor small subunit
MIKVRLFATFRLLAGIKSLELDMLAGTSVLDAVRAIVEQIPVLRPHWLDGSGGLHAHVHILLDGEDVATLPEGLQTVLPQEAGLDFFPPVAGG